jgi:hypothetical protein
MYYENTYLKKIIFDNKPKKKSKTLTNQMVHYPPIKMINQIVQHFASQKDHPNMLNMSISTCPNW